MYKKGRLDLATKARTALARVWAPLLPKLEELRKQLADEVMCRPRGFDNAARAPHYAMAAAHVSPQIFRERARKDLETNARFAVRALHRSHVHSGVHRPSDSVCVVLGPHCGRSCDGDGLAGAA